MFKKISIKDRLPKEGTPVPTIDTEGNVIVYKRFGNTWNMPKLENNHAIEYWLEEVPESPTSWQQIKSFEDACTALNIKPESVYHSEDSKDEIAYKKLKVIAKAINWGWVPDWDDTDAKKWYPYFCLSSGFGFSGSNYDCARTNTHVGSRLCFESSEKSSYAGKQFIDLYKDLLTNND